jgi:hypothetical protein
MAGTLNLSLSPLNLNPQRFEYPSLMMYLSAALIFVGTWTGHIEWTHDLAYYLDDPDRMAALYTVGRVIAAVLGSLTLV